MSGRFRELQYFGEWPPYQRAALAAFEKGRHHGRGSTHIVSPPGSGTTILGVELIRRIGRRALVLCPNQAVQQQWPKAVSAFTAQPWSMVGPDPLKPIACLTYQGLCDIEDPEMVLGRLAQSRWADERAAETGITPEEAMREFEGEDADQRARELARIQGVLKREVAQGEAAGIELRDLLSTSARERVQQLSKLGVSVVVLDECHHLASLWGYVIRAVLGALGDDVHVVGLTPTPPVGLPEADAELYAALLGPVDFTVPTPAVVRDGQLAPYQELVWLTEPVAAEQAYLAEHDARFQELTERLRADGAFTDWVRGALPKRPRLARAGARFLGHGRTELDRQPPDLEDWLRLLETYALRQLAPQDAPEAQDAYEEIAAALRELGFELTAKGVPRGLGRRRPAPGQLAGQARGHARDPDRRGRVTRRPLPRARAVRHRVSRAARRRRAVGHPRPQRDHRPPPAARDRRRPAHDGDAPAAGLQPRPALRPRRRRRPARGAARGRRGALRPAGLGGRGRGAADHAALLRRGVDAARLGRAGHDAARRRRHDRCWSAPARCSATSGCARR